MNFVLTIEGKRIGSGTYAEMLDLADRHGIIGCNIITEDEETGRRWLVFIPGRRWHKDGTELASALARGCALYPVTNAFSQSKPLSAA